MISTLILVFRELIEAGLIVGIVLAATKGVKGGGLAVTLGVAGGLLGAGLVAAFAGVISNLFQGTGQELFNAAILAVAVVMLAWHNIWMASHGREMAREMNELGGRVASGSRTLGALSIVVAVAVLREGSELVLFLYGVAASGGTDMAGMLTGGALGVGAGIVVSALIYFGLLSIPTHKLFKVTGLLITLVAAGLAAQSVGFLQSAGLLQTLAEPLWDTSMILSQSGSVAGRILHTLVGYMDQPNLAQVFAWLAVVAAMTLGSRLAHTRH
jgi:high-affinity iron transporter